MGKKIAAKTATKKAKRTVVNKPTIGKDGDGFRVGSKGAKMFALLKKRCTHKELVKAGGPAVPGFLAGIVRPIDEWSAGREAVIVKDEKSIWIATYKTKDGKKHIVRVVAPKKKTTKSRASRARAAA